MKHQKHLAWLLGCSLLLTTCILPAPKAGAAKIKLNKKKLTLQVKQSYTLKLKNYKKKIKWSSSNKKIATVTSKGKVKAKKAGKATITAKVGKKKYTCKVTVKKANTTKVTPRPKVTVTPQKTTAPQPDSTTQATMTPSATPEASSSAEPDLSPEKLAENVSIERQIFPEHIILTVTNNNTVWLDNVTVTYEYYGLDDTSIASGYEELFYLKPGESQYIAVPLITGIAMENLDTAASFETATVTAPDPTGIYSDQSDKVEIIEETSDYDTASLTLNFKNHSPLDVKGSYLIYFYDASGTLLDANCNIIDLNGKERQNEYIDMPEQCTKYEIKQYSAHSFEEIDTDIMLAKGVSAVAEKLADCIIVRVTNANSQWLNFVNIDYDFYDAEDNFLSSGNSLLLSMGPGEVQSLIIDPNIDDISEIDLNYSVANIKAEKASVNDQYQHSSLVTASIEADEEDEEGYTITFTNAAELPIDGSYIIYFHDSLNTEKIVTAKQETLSIPANDSHRIYLETPVLYDENGDRLPIASLTDTDIQIFAHTFVVSNENQ